MFGMNHKEKKHSPELTSEGISGIPPASSPADQKIFFRMPRGPKKADYFLRQQRRWQFLRAGLVGLLAGTIAVFFQHAVFLSGKVSGMLAAFLQDGIGMYGRLVFCLITALLSGLSAWMTGRYAAEAAGSGIPHVKAVLLNLRRMRPGRVIVTKFLCGWMALVSGMSLGREGPTVQIGAAVGQWMAQRFRVLRRSYPGLVAAGAGAGLAAAFNAPLAGFLFVMEELRREMSSLTYGTALAASVCAVMVERWFLGQGSTFYLSDPSPLALKWLPAVALLGVFGGYLGVWFNRSLVAALDLRDRIRIPRWLLGAAIGALAGVIFLIEPNLTGTGHEFTQELLQSNTKIRWELGVVLLYLVVRFGFTTLCYSTGMPGGIFAPILAMGALLGYAYGTAFDHLLPSWEVSPAIMATLGMGALLVGAVRSPLTGVVLIVEMTSEYRLLYALLLASFVAYLTAEALRDMPIYERLLKRDIFDSSPVRMPEKPVLFEVLIESDSPLDRTLIRQAGFPDGVQVVSLARGDGYLVPGGDTRLQAGDLLTVQVNRSDPGRAVHQVQQAATSV